jgi:D-alanyl-D-alanine carboxypeptidase/D-alanyl-D-alanine-endopeptidase (penicillin-binding protein 4)
MRLRRLVALPLWLVLGSCGAPVHGGAAAAEPTAAVEVLVAPRPAPADSTDAAAPRPWPTRIEDRLADLSSRTAAQARAAAAVDQAFAQELAAIAASAGPGTEVGISVRALDSGATVFELGGDAPLNPASNHKLVTAVAALELLGADYRFSTRALVDGDALVLVGEGDPSLQPADLAALAREIAAQSDLPAIRRIVVDDSAFSDERFGPGYDADGPGYSYLAPSSALSVHWNTIAISVTPTERGAPVEVAIDPPCAHVDVVVEATTGRGPALTVETQPVGDRTRVVVRGTLSRRDGVAQIRRRIADPALFAGSVLARALADLGLPEPEVVRGRASEGATAIALHLSPPLPEVLHSALKYSNNFTTEQILRTLGHRLTGAPGDWENGREAIARFWGAIGRDPAELVFENAAGYSRRGRLSARALVELLQFALSRGEAATLLPALAVAGKDGTLRDRLHDVAGRVLAKTGSLAGTSALTGVIVDDAGTPRLGFSILLNGAVDRRSGARLQDRLVRALLAHG